MDVSIISFSARGAATAELIAEALRSDGDTATVSTCHGDARVDLDSWTEQAFGTRDALVFVGATGIAVRSIAPYVRHKTQDPAVIVADDLGRFCIPLLSGHIGGANNLAVRIAAHLGATPVITTATDVGGVFAVDSWAVSQGLAIMDPDAIKTVSGLLLSGSPVRVASDFTLSGQPPEGVELIGSSGSLTPSPDVQIGVHRGMRGLRLVPKAIVLGVGCKRGTSADRLEEAFSRFCATLDIEPAAVTKVATIDLKSDEAGLLAFCATHGLPLKTFSAQELNAVSGDFTSSDFVKSVTGTDNVCQRAVVASAGQLLEGRLAEDGVTMAAGILPISLTWDEGAYRPLPGNVPGRLAVVGLGPGDPRGMTQEALDALRTSDLVCGYPVYVKLAAAVCPDVPTFTTPMTEEVERCRAALEAAARGRRVAMVCSGDAGVYGMASPLLELAPAYPDVDITVISGVTAALSGAAVLGAPLACDFAVISLSDRLTPWDTIAARLDAAASSDLCICLYNPASHARTEQLRKACDIVLHHLSPSTPCGYVRDIGRSGQQATVCTLGELRDATLDMSTTAFIGNSTTAVIGGRMVTPRGYRIDDAREHGTILLFGGTVEGRRLACELAGRGFDVTVCVATRTGSDLLPDDDPHIHVLCGRLDQERMEQLMRRGFQQVVDATHPYATEVTANIRAAAGNAGITYLRLKRPSCDCSGCRMADDLASACALIGDDGNILSTTGTKDIEAYASIPSFRKRVFARVLDNPDSIARCRSIGLSDEHIIAQAGPFSTQDNVRAIREHAISTIVTKESGTEGGFPQKVEAARICGCDIIVIRRPEDGRGYTYDRILELLGEPPAMGASREADREDG